MKNRVPQLVILLVVVLFAVGCSNPFRKTKAMPPAPGAVPARIPDKPIQQMPKAGRANLPEPPPLSNPEGGKPKPVSTAGVPTALPKTTKVKQPPKPKKPKVAAKRQTPAPGPVEPQNEPAVNTAAEVATESAPAAAAAQEPAAPAFTLGAILSPQQRAALQKQTEQLLSSCEQAIQAASSKSLNGRQVELLGRIRTFVAQAKEAKDRNPAEAKNLAERGKLFADALSGELR